MASPRSASRKKIEPLDYTVAAMAPALKGMTSFLDLPADAVRAMNARNLVRVDDVPSPEEAARIGESSVSEVPPGDKTTSGVIGTLYAETVPSRDIPDKKSSGDDTSPGGKTFSWVGLTTTPSSSGSFQKKEELARGERLQGDHSRIEDKKTSGATIAPGDKTTSGGHLGDGVAVLRQQIRHKLQSLSVDEVQQIASQPLGRRHQKILERAVSENVVVKPIERASEITSGSFTDSKLDALSGSKRGSGNQLTSGVETNSEIASLIYTPAVVSVPLVPGIGRSKIRKCVLAQDGHSLGEEAIYQILWRSGTPETEDPNGARVISIGAADIGMRANMAKKNVRQNISRLYEKLAIEIIEDFETVSSKPRRYRVYSSKQILERRRAAGLEYVLRNKGVVFCSASGAEIKALPVDQKTPGDETLIRPALSKRQRHLQQAEVRRDATLPVHAQSTEIPPEDLRQISEALNLYGLVNEDVAIQLVRNCRREKSDAMVAEILFFVREKMELIKSNRAIANPVGLILATVPKSFVGQAFVEFRNRMLNQAELAAEDENRRRREEEEMRNWLQEQVSICENIVNDATKSQQERDVAEQRLREFAHWNV